MGKSNFQIELEYNMEDQIRNWIYQKTSEERTEEHGLICVNPPLHCCTVKICFCEFLNKIIP